MTVCMYRLKAKGNNMSNDLVSLLVFEDACFLCNLLMGLVSLGNPATNCVIQNGHVCPSRDMQ